MTIFDDEDFLDRLVAQLIQDKVTAKSCAFILEGKDFSPIPGQNRKTAKARWLVATVALNYYRKYLDPPKSLIKSEVVHYSNSLKLTDKSVTEAVTYAKARMRDKIHGASSVVDKVVEFKKQKLKADTVEELVSLQTQGKLTDDVWLEKCQSALRAFGSVLPTENYFDEEELENRIQRRKSKRVRRPFFFIDPLDALVVGVGAGELGLVMAPYKRGKSLFLIHVARAYSLQGLNVLYVTLEDTRETVEDRFDASATALPIRKLSTLPKTLRSRFRRVRAMMRSRLTIVDGTEGNVTIPRIEQILTEELDKGFPVDAIIIDYDDEIVPTKRREQRRFEFADIYRDMRVLAAKHRCIVWTGAQTQRGTENLKILSADRLAEDISKIRKVTMAVSIGKGELGDKSLYLWVAGHKNDSQHIGCHIISDLKRMLLYDREATAKALKKESHV